MPYHCVWKYNHQTGINIEVKCRLYFAKSSGIYVEIACGAQTVLIARTAETVMIFVCRHHWSDQSKKHYWAVYVTQFE